LFKEKNKNIGLRQNRQGDRDLSENRQGDRDLNRQGDRDLSENRQGDRDLSEYFICIRIINTQLTMFISTAHVYILI